MKPVRNTRPSGPQEPTREAVLRAVEEVARSCGWPDRHAMRRAVLRERALLRMAKRTDGQG